MEDSELIVTVCLIMIVSSLILISAIITWMECKRLRTWWRNRGWRAGMRIRLDEIKKEYDTMAEFCLVVKEGFAGRGLLKGTLAVARSEDPEVKKFLIRFIEDGLEEIAEEGRELERAIREL